MIKLFAKLFIKDRENISSPNVRKSYGIICSVCGILLNLMLFFFKMAAGTVSGSVAVTVDAVHNLTDSASSIVTLISFLLSGQKKTKKFPMGKGRIEYVAGFIIAMVLVTAGIELAKASVLKIITPEPVTFSFFSVSLLIISVLTKFYMAHYGFFYSKKISSAALKAAATDCFCDSFATLIAAFAVISVKFTSLNIDAWGGLTVSLFIFYSGIKALKDTVKMIIGTAPSTEQCEKISGIMLSLPEIRDIGNIILHDYGPENRFFSFDAYFEKDLPLSSVTRTVKNAGDRIFEETGLKAEIKAIL